MPLIKRGFSTESSPSSPFVHSVPFTISIKHGSSLMDKACTHQEEETTAIHLQNHSHKLCFPLVSLGASDYFKSFPIFVFWVSKSLQNFKSRARFSNMFCFKNLPYDFMVVNNSVVCSSPGFDEGQKGKMEALIENGECMGQKIEVFADNVSENETVVDSTSTSEESTPSSDFFPSETTGNEGRSRSLSDDSSSVSTGWSVEKTDAPDCNSANSAKGGETPYFDQKKSEKNVKLQKQCSTMSEMEMMKERFSKLLLGEDMSGCGNGVSTALAISNAITNLCATLFGQLWRLEPFPSEKKLMWRREIEWLLCVSDHIVELIPNWQTFPDGSKLEVMTCRPRADLYVNLPALRKLDNMLLDMLDSFESKEFWYVDQGILAQDVDGSSTFAQALQRREEKWWLPVPRVPPGGLHENTRKQLQHKRDCTNQILKAAMAINSVTLADMDVPESYLGSLPKNGRASSGDVIYRYISLDPFSPECILDCLAISSEHQAIEAANRIEASIHLWRKKTNSRPSSNTTRYSSKSSWEMVKELMVDADKWDLLADRAETLLLCLKQRFPGLSQTTLDVTKIQHNKDVGKSILESYSRVLESLAFNIVARIDDLVHVDDLTKCRDQFSSLSESGMISHRSCLSAPICTTPYKSASTSPNISPRRVVSPEKGGNRSPTATPKVSQQGLGVKKVLTDYLTIEPKVTEFGNLIGKSGLITSVMRQMRVYDSVSEE